MGEGMVELTINGRKIKAEAGQTILEAARDFGIYIPTLCSDPDLKPYGGCRICVVEVEKARCLQTACTTMVNKGMVVYTESETVKQARRTIVDLLLADHPQDCLTCVKNQRCELQKVAAYLGITERRFPRIDKNLPVDDSNPFFTLARNYCILCGKCVRTCEEITSVNAIDLADRGYDSHVATFNKEPIFNSICRSCGECVERCPTAALVSKKSVIAEESTLTVCPYCGVGCGLYLNIRQGKIVSVKSEHDNKSSNGRLCVKGRYGITDFVHSKDRLTSPLIRKKGKLTEASWDEALSLVAKKLVSYDSDQLAVIASAKCTNEDNYVIQKLARAVLKTNNVDHCARLCHAPTVAGLVQSFGSGAMTNSIGDIKDSGCILSIGSNTTDSHPVIGFAVKKAAKNGAKLIVVNPRRIPLVRYADIWLRHKPGSDVALLNGIMKVILDEGLEDTAYIKKRCQGFEELAASLKKVKLSEVATITCVAEEDIIKAARMYATNGTASIFYSMGITQHSHGTDNVIATANLSMLCGNIGKAGGGVNPLRGQNNVQGACDMGALPNVYPGYQLVSDGDKKNKFEKSWGCNLSDSKGLTLTEMIIAADTGKLKAIYLVGENPSLSEADSCHAVEALKKLDFLVVQDIFLAEITEIADVVLPAASFAEKEGTFTNTERRVQRVRKAVEPPGDSRPDWLITCQIARKMGAPGFTFKNPSQIMDELASLTPQYGGISFKRLDKEGGLQWPCPAAGHPGTPILHCLSFTCGKGRLMPLEYKPPAELPDDEYPLLLTTGRNLFHFHTGTMTRKVAGLNAFMERELVEMNPADAARLKLKDGEKVNVTSRRGQIEATISVTDVSDKGTVFMTFHFAESPTNHLTNPVLDPVAKIPEFKVCAVRVDKLKVK
jgi:formate dehydrogenase alpha subunit